MRKLLLFFVLLSGLTFGQNFNTKGIDSLQFEKTNIELTKNLRKSFIKVSDNIFDENRRYVKYENKEDGEKLFIIYTIRNEGENKDLERKGTRLWTILTLTGNYMTIFDFYKKYYNPNADLEKIQKMGQDWNAPQQVASIRKNSQEGLWEIKFW